MKKGFTLIELLAVIVILAIIALIAVPIVLNIINDSKESSLLRSAEFYLDAVEYTIADAFLYHGGLEDNTYPITPNGDICKVNESPCTDANILKVEVNGDKPTGGSITINGGNISDVSLILDEKTIVKNSDGELVYAICKLISGNKDTPGSKYECEVKSGVKYNFYVLSQESNGTTNLIMERNICSDGTVATDSNKCPVAWISKTDYNDDTNYGTHGNNNKGPITAMKYLNQATSSWSNIDNLNITYNDASGNYTGFEIKGKSRLPYRSEVDNVNENNVYLYEYLDGSFWNGTIEPSNHVTGVMGYWLLSTDSNYSNLAYYVAYGGAVALFELDQNSGLGVRPVINLKL